MSVFRAPKIVVSKRRGAGPPRAVLWGVLALAAGGCAEPELATYYGRRQLPLSSASVNGTDVLAGMFAEEGHTVAVRRVLVTSDMDGVDTVVWFPDDFSAPRGEVCRWFDDWLAAASGRTLVYVGRGFDAASVYYRKMTPLVPPDQQAEYRKREKGAMASSQQWPQPKADELNCDWFEIDPQQAREVRELAGPWSEGIVAANSELELGWRLVPRDGQRPLLTSAGEAIAARQQRPAWKESQLVVVANGSFLLNLPLVNHEHRKLAGKLIEEVGRPGRVVFLESDRGGPPVDPPATDSSLWRVFGAWPLDAILLHFAVVGVIFCFARWPIFGRPKTPPAEAIADFGKHVEAVGELLRRTKDRNYALARLPPSEDVVAMSGQAAQRKPRVRGSR